VFRQDYLLRLIEQFADALRRIAGLRKKGDYDAALGDIESTWNKLLDVPYQLVDVVDTATLAAQLKEPANMRIAAQLLAEEAQALAGKGDPVHASVRYRRALELFLEARAVDPQPDDEAAILELSRHVHANQLDPRYRR
jgi:tetratricopeptide (TPR) repeat protein